MSAIQYVIDRLNACRRPLSQPYRVPGLWIDFKGVAPQQVDPYDFYVHRLGQLLATEPHPLVHGTGGGEWSRNAIVYSLFPRLTTAFDHNGDFHLSTDASADGWRETGTLLKCAALLPYIKSMGFNTIHLLPVQSIGQDNKKGTLGSPYAIRNPYQLDPSLAEPVLDLNAETLFAAFVEGAHRLGMRVVMEFVLRVAARDSDWIREHPDWFYWIRADIPERTGSMQAMGVARYLSSFGSPHFSGDTLNLIKHKVGSGDFYDLPAPSANYQNLFTHPPHPDRVFQENGRYFGTLDDGTRVRVPGGFCDYPPDDPQPPWVDVTYLRLYHHPDFNYMAYNTLRMYDSRLAHIENANEPLWQTMIGIIPHYAQHYGIDGVMIDMGHALPLSLKLRVIAAARQVNPDFAFWDETFGVSRHSREEGYNAVMGYWMLGAHHGDNLRGTLRQMASHSFALPFLAAPENHDTPRAAARAGGTIYSHYALSMAIATPAIPFIQTGFELGETQPMNTGLGFSQEEIAKYPPETLPLFSEAQFNWTRPDNLVRSVQVALDIRNRYAWLLADPDPSTVQIGHSDNPALIVFARKKGDAWLSFIGNADPYREHRGRAVLDHRRNSVPGVWGTGTEGMGLAQESVAHVTLSPNYVLIVEGGGLG